MEKCICHTTLIKDTVCELCSFTFSEPPDEFYHTPSCKNKPIIICGERPSLCSDCEIKGWIVVGGHGGQTYFYNKRNPKKEFVIST